jgi:hypothetical protein
MSDNDLKAELDRFKARTAELEAKLVKLAEVAKATKLPQEPFIREPHKPLDLTANASMPWALLREMVAAVPDKLMADLRADALKPNPVTQSRTLLTPVRPGQVERGSGYRDALPLTAPPGIDLCDRQMDAQDAQDRADLARRLARAKGECG